jgi:hypothetical protein
MVARTPPAFGLRVTLFRDGAEVDTEVATTREDARDSALLIIGRLEDFRHGDVLICMKM